MQNVDINVSVSVCGILSVSTSFNDNVNPSLRVYTDIRINVTIHMDARKTTIIIVTTAIGKNYSYDYFRTVIFSININLNLRSTRDLGLLVSILIRM